ncbi:MAG: T9SS type A sorting domain-containing protein [Cytophagales bacterium]|nr:T9SS type A sorting domain-containing protein [Cytophagales bacterium]
MDGTLDGTFNPGTGANDYVDATSIQSDGKIIIGGRFTSYNGTGRNRIARLLNCFPSIPTITQNGDTLSSSTANSYQWFFNGDTIPGETSQIYTATQSGFYMVSITDANGCSAASDSLSVTISSIKEYKSIYGLKIYPNPNTGEFNIVMLVPNEVRELQLKIVNNLGQVLFREKLKQFKGIYEKQLDLNKYPAGIYKLQLISKKGVINKQIIIIY